MAKLKNVTQAELDTAKASTEEPIGTIHDLVHRMETGYCDTLDDPLALASHFQALTRASADLVSKLLYQHGRQEQQRELDALRKRAAE